MFPPLSRRHLCLTTMLAFLLLLGCSPSRKALSTENAERIQTLQVLAVTPDEGPRIQVQQAMTGSQNFGLVGALVDAAVTSSRENTADEDIVTLRAALTDFDYHDTFARTIAATVDSATWPGRIASVDDRRGEFETGSDDFRSRLTSMSEDACLVLRSETFLSPQAVCLVIATDADLYLDGKEPAYSCHFNYFSAPRSSKDQKVAVAEWAADDAKAYREAVATGIAWTVQMLQRDLLAPDRFPQSSSEKELSFDFEALEGTYPIKVKGKVLTERQGTYLVRDSSGYLYAFDQRITEKIKEVEPPPENMPSRFKRQRS